MSEEIEFYDVKKREGKIISDKIKKQNMEKIQKIQPLCFRGSVDNRNLTKFCSQKDWEQQTYL